MRSLWLPYPCPFPHIKTCGLSLTGTFGRIFHGVLLDEKDPNKEKQVFVKTVKGMCLTLAAIATWGGKNKTRKYQVTVPGFITSVIMQRVWCFHM